MKRNQFQELKIKPEEELSKLLIEKRDRLWQLKTDLAAGKVKNVREIRLLKETIAQLLTLINQHE